MKLGHSCTRHSTVPCGLSLTDDITRGTSSRGGEWLSERVGAGPTAPGRGRD
jgi:hypothetical protein